MTRTPLLSVLSILALAASVACAPQGGPSAPTTLQGESGQAAGGASGSPGTAGANNPGANGGSPAPGGAGGAGQPAGSPAGTGRLTIRLTDTPFEDATAVLVTFSEVRVHRSASEDVEGVWEVVPFAGDAASRTCDLKQLEGPTDLLGVAQLPAGFYTQIRLVVTAASIHFENPAAAGPCAAVIDPPDAGASMKVPSGEVKLNRPFTVAEGGATTILLDFDGNKSIVQTGPGNGRGNAGNVAASGNAGNAAGRGKGPANAPGKGGGHAEEEEEEEEEVEAEDDDAAGGPGGAGYIMKPVISVVSVQ